MGTSLLKTGLLQYAVKCTRSEVIAGFRCHRYATRLDRVLELPVAAPGRYEIPPVLAQHTEDLAYFHGRRVSAEIGHPQTSRSCRLTPALTSARCLIARAC